MSNFKLTSEIRSQKGKGEANRLRKINKIPGVIYGPDKPSTKLAVDVLEFQKALSQGVNLFDLSIDGTSRTAIVKDLTKDPVKGTLIHVDFYEVSMDKPIETTVQLRIINEAARPNDGGVVIQNLREVQIACLPGDIPEAIEVDVSQVELGTNLLVGELAAPNGVEILADRDEVVISVSEPRVEEAETEDDDASESTEEVKEETEA